MRIDLQVSPEREAELRRYLQSLGFILDREADLVLTERSQFRQVLNGKRDNTLYPIPVEEIISIESYGKSMELHTRTGTYRIRERLRELEGVLDPAKFLRVSNSAIVALGQIQKIQPTFGMKFILTMKDGSTIDVTRSYYYLFRDALGI